MVVLSLRERNSVSRSETATMASSLPVPGAVAQRMPQYVTLWGIEDSAPATQICKLYQYQ
jgi:hypothetical protein